MLALTKETCSSYLGWKFELGKPIGGKPPPYCENLLYQQDVGRKKDAENES